METEPLHVDANPVGRVQEFDGMRALAMAAVVAYHLDFRHVVPGGFVGVDVFFVLSGYLITLLLLDEISESARIDVWRFYQRRALRLLPALAAVLAVCLVATAVAPSRSAGTLQGLPWVVLYTGNWDRAMIDPTALGLLAHTWSLAIEEQFYLLWPAALALTLTGASRLHGERVRSLASALLGLAGIEIVYRSIALADGWGVSRIYNGLDTHSDGLLIGCGIAFLVRAPSRTPGRHRYAGWAATLGAVMVAVPAATGRYSSGIQLDVAISAAGVGTGLFLWALVVARPGPIATVLSWPPLVWLGRRSYGVYLWHFPVLLLIGNGGVFPVIAPLRPLGRVGASAVVVVLAVALAAVSYRWIEMPARRSSRDRRRPIRIRAAGGRTDRSRASGPRRCPQ